LILGARQNRWSTALPYNEKSLLKSRIESSEIGKVGAMLSVGIDHHGVEPGRLGNLKEFMESLGVETVRDLRMFVRNAEVRQNEVR
jgi:hypothetical protein